MTGTAYAVIDGTDGRTHHVRLPGVEALDTSPPIGCIVEVRAIGKPPERRIGVVGAPIPGIARQGGTLLTMDWPVNYVRVAYAN